MLSEMTDNVRRVRPLVHNITNYVTVNDCANIILACGASPIMSDEQDEVREIATLCNGLNINIGTLNRHTIPAMLTAGFAANACNCPVLLDPVGAGASQLRTETALMLMRELNISVIRGNASEINALAHGSSATKGVDVNSDDIVKANNLDASMSMVRELAQRTSTVIAMTGEIDIVSDGRQTFVIRNGHAMMERITGAGCMLSAMMTAYLAANVNHPLLSAAAATCAMGICGELAFARLSSSDGNATYRNYLLDAVYNLQGADVEVGAKYEVR